jgi:hypothetical protein
LSSADACDGDTSATVFAELESMCVGHAGDADAVCGAIVSKRSAHGAGLDIGLLRLWLRRLPESVSCNCVAFLSRNPAGEVMIVSCADCADCTAAASCRSWACEGQGSCC